MDPSLRLSCEELLELPYFQEEGGANWGRDGERLGRRHDKASRRRQAGVSMKHGSLIIKSLNIKLPQTSRLCTYDTLHTFVRHTRAAIHFNVA